MTIALKVKVDAFRDMHHDPPLLVLPNAWDAVTARLFVKVAPVPSLNYLFLWHPNAAILGANASNQLE
jgi:hypothetical protein